MAKNYLIGFDIGSFFTKAILFEYENEKYKPIAYKKAKTEGIINGEIQDLEGLKNTINSLIDFLNGSIPKKYRSIEIAVGYSTNDLRITSENFTVGYREKTEIHQKDLFNIKKNIMNKYKEDSNLILDSQYVEFILDGKKVKNPIAFYAQDSLSTSVNTVWVPENSFALLVNVFKNIIEGQIPLYDSSLATAYSVTTPNDREAGITFIDFGYHMVRIIIFKNGIPRLFYPFPYGMKYVIKDISNVLKTTEEEAHKLLVENAFCLRDTKTIKKIDFQGLSSNNNPYVSQNLLNKIVYARIREIISRFNGDISKIGYERTFEVGALQGGIVYTGGGSKIRNIEQTIKELMGDNFRKGVLTSSSAFVDIPPELAEDSDYLSVFGIVDRYRFEKTENAEEAEKPKVIEKEQNSSSDENMLSGKKKNKENSFLKKILEKLTGADEDAF